MWLRGKINIALAVCIGAPLALGFGAIWFGAQETMREAGTREIATATHALANTLEDRTAQSLGHLTTWSKLSVMQDVLIGDESGELTRTLKSFAARYTDFAKLTVTDAQGNVVATTAADHITSHASDEGFRSAASGRAFQSALTLHPSTMRETVSFTVPLIARHDGHSVIGTLNGVVDFGAVVKAIAAPSALGANGSILILTKRNGQIIFASRTDSTLLEALHGAHDAGELTWRGEPYFIASAGAKKKALLQDLGLIVQAIAPASAVLATTNELLNRFLIVAGLAAIAAFWLAWRWTTPLVQLESAMDALSRGNFLYRGPKTKPTDAFAPMARAFEIMRQMRAVREKLGAREGDLREAKEQAEAALKAKSEHLATLSYALSEQLSTIVRLSDLINREALDAASGETRSVYAKDIARTGASLLAVIQDLFDLSEVEAGHVNLNETETDLTQLVRESCDRMQQAAFAAQVTLGRDGIDKPLNVRCDAGKLKQVMAHLLSNAVKFTPAGGLVTVHLRLTADGCPTIAIEDTGIGMTATLKPVAATLDDPDGPGHHGAGLGLPLARELVELHNGTLEIESEADKGTTVTVKLPADRLIETSEERLTA
jgi:signal transduction histidine kinase